MYSGLMNPEESPRGDRWKTVTEMEKMGRAAVEYLIIDLWDTDKKVRMAAADALGTLGDKRALPYLAALLKDPDHDVRFASAVALGMLGDKNAVDALKSACHDANCFVRLAAEESLEKLAAKKVQ